jgi:GDP-L-fucose synthase
MQTSSDFWVGKRVLVTGAQGFVGSNLVPLLEAAGCDLIRVSRTDYDLLDQQQVRRMFAETKPEVVFNTAGYVGGILANKSYPADFCYQNLLMGTMVLHEAWSAGVGRYVTLIGGCSYPAKAANPIAETTLFEGYPQAESAPYSLAKAMSVVQAQAYRKQYGFKAIVLVPGNLYGPFDNFDLANSHVVAGLVRKYYEAKMRGDDEIIAWGSGKPIRDFVYVGDACEAIVRAAEVYDGAEIINISSGVPTTIRELVETIAELSGFRGKVRWDATKPDGQMEKLFDVTRMREWLGFECRTSLREGVRKTIEWFETNYASLAVESPA